MNWMHNHDLAYSINALLHNSKQTKPNPGGISLQSSFHIDYIYICRFDLRCLGRLSQFDCDIGSFSNRIRIKWTVVYTIIKRTKIVSGKHGNRVPNIHNVRTQMHIVNCMNLQIYYYLIEKTIHHTVTGFRKIVLNTRYWDTFDSRQLFAVPAIFSSV